MNITMKHVGVFLIVFSVILLGILIFVKEDTDETAAYICENLDHSNEEVLEQCPSHDTTFSWMLLAAFGIAVLMFGLGGYLFFISGREEFSELKKEFKDVDISKLDPDEKTVYDLVKQKEGSAYQTDLIKETGFSKVKITRVLDKLELKGIIERKRRGMTNIIVLK